MDKNIQEAVAGLRQQDFFRTIQDPTVAATEKDRLRAEKLQQFADKAASAAAGGNLSGWSAHIQAELRSNGAPLPEILRQLKKMHSVEEHIASAGHSGGHAHGHHHGSLKVENVPDAPGDVKPDAVTPETQGAYRAAQEAKTETQSPSAGS